jgi:hypothetical protein
MAMTANDAHAVVTSIKGKSIELKPTHDTPLRTDDRVLIYRLRASRDRRPEPLGVALITSSNGEKAAGTLLAKDRDVYTDDIAVCIGPARAAEQE